MFDEILYRVEMTRLLQTAIDRLRRDYPTAVVYTASIWTDPNAAISAVSFDTIENSSAKVAEADIWAEGHYRRLLEEGDVEGAKSFAPRNEPTRNVNPADFQFRSIAEVEHRSFPENWEEISNGKCWNELESALNLVRSDAAEMMRQLRLHDEAELAVNSRSDWYDHTIRLPPHAV